MHCIYVVQHTRLNTTANVICFCSSEKNDERVFTDIPLTTCLLFVFCFKKRGTCTCGLGLIQTKCVTYPLISFSALFLLFLHFSVAVITKRKE